MKLLNPYTGEMICRFCGTQHFASIKPNSNGHYYRGSWQCSNEQCPTNQKLWSEEKQRWVKVGAQSGMVQRPG
jgi:hypothetical protein